MNNFDCYNRVLISAFAASNKQKEFITRKYQLLHEVYNYHSINPKSELYLGFNPAMIYNSSSKSYVYGIDPQDFIYLKNHNNSLIRIDSLDQLPSAVDSIISGDEFFTFMDHETEQRSFLSECRKYVSRIVVTTLRDYKNQDFKDKEFSFPSIIDHNGPKIYLEYHNHDGKLKNQWATNIYEINGTNLTIHGPFDRKAVYFKQLAKFTNDAGFSDFVVHKNLMYKSIIRKNYEHVISFS